MTGKTITTEQLSKAVKAYCCSNLKQSSIAEDGKIRIFTGTPDPATDKVLWLDGGNLRGSDLDFTLGFAEEWLQGPSKALSPVGKGNMSTPERYARKGPINGSAMEAVRECQATEKPVYSTGGGRKAAAAKTNIAALMEAGGSMSIVSREHRTDFIEVVVRAGLGDRFVDSSISIYKQEYLAKKAWDWIVKVLMDEPGIVTGTDEYGMPEFREGATIKVRISEVGRSLMVALPAKIALWRELAREWQFAGRVCESKAYSRAADMLLRGDFQSKEELAEERAEVEKVAEGGKAEAA